MAEAEEEVQEELDLAKEMKEKFCVKSGKETNQAKVAVLMHRIGLIYRKRSPDKISLIKSAGLLNAAIFRNPSNVSQIKSDLSDLCQHVLLTSNAKNQNADLIKQGKLVKAFMTEMREKVEALLKSKVPLISKTATKKSIRKQNAQKINAIQQINKTVADNYTKLMAKISQYCENVMGKPPCDYVVVGMGSLAREEITPYSDFEHVILLFDDENYKSYLEYFKWYSVIFHLIVLNVQETIVPSLHIKSLNNNDSSLGDWFYDAITPRGLSFDGMMPHACKFPLGREQFTKNKPFVTELIKPVGEMLKYLTSEADLKNGYHLADILTKTCFVFGSNDIFMTFVKGAQNYLDRKTETDITNSIHKQVKEDLNSFSTRFRLTNLRSQNTINIKQLVYRSTTIFISALARKHNIKENSCFAIIDKMKEIEKMTQNTAEKLKCAIAIACEMRLKVYMKNNSQCDNAIDLTQDGIDKFLNIVGVVSTISYFQVAYCLQCEVAKQLNFAKLHFYSNPQLINIAISLALGLDDVLPVTCFSRNPQKYLWDLQKFDFDKCINQLETDTIMMISEKTQSLGQKIIQTTLNIFHRNSPHFFDCTHGKLRAKAKQLKSVAKNLYSIDMFDEALDFYKQLMDVYQNSLKENDLDIAWVNHHIGLCLFYLNQPADALKYYVEALQIKQNASPNIDEDLNVAKTLYEIGCCHVNLQNYNEALMILNQSLDIQQCTTPKIDFERSIAVTLHEIGRCEINLGNYNEALSKLHTSLEIDQRITSNCYKDKNIAVTLHEIGRCHLSMNNYDKALENLYQALKIK